MYGHDDKKFEIYRIEYKDRDCFLEYANHKNNLMEYKCLCCNENYQKKFDENLNSRFFICCNQNSQKKFDENLKKQFFNTYKFSNHDINKFLLLLRKCVYPHEYMDDWKKVNKTLQSAKH